ncbi:hypothetical protein D1AOALGA4SA_12317 [Olavius algarvensis Delta 1 endosymbiont]|nr:hypothetical protein D1AOALGA4SA_12317 [Olavius algarvensis Delta 1 endosymbiont]
MKKIIPILLLFTILYSCSLESKNPIIGRWKSDEIETLNEIRNSGSLSETQIEILTSKVKFGKLILEIDADEITSYYEGNVDTEQYKLINFDGSLVEIESRNPHTNELEKVVIEVRDKKMWIPSTLVKFREVFVKIE